MIRKCHVLETVSVASAEIVSVVGVLTFHSFQPIEKEQDSPRQGQGGQVPDPDSWVPRYSGEMVQRR